MGIHSAADCGEGSTVHGQGEDTVVATGVIIGPEAKGTVTITSSDTSGITVHIEDAWIAPGAPDVRVYLSADRGGDVTTGASVELGIVTALTGHLVFAVAPAVGLSAMRSLVVYCKVYSVLFGVAPLEHVAA